MIFERFPRLPDIGGPNGQIAMLVAADMKDLSGLKEEGKRPFEPEIFNLRLAVEGKGIFISQFLYKERKGRKGFPTMPRSRFAMPIARWSFR